MRTFYRFVCIKPCIHFISTPNITELHLWQAINLVQTQKSNKEENNINWPIENEHKDIILPPGIQNLHNSNRREYTTSIQAVKDIAETTMIIATLVDQYNIYYKELKIEK